MIMKKNLVPFGLTLFAAALLLLVGAGSAAAETQTFRSQESFSIFVPCANGGLGETVQGIAKVHAVFGVTEDGAGGFHVHAQVKYRGSGLGDVTGDTYRFHADVPEFGFFADRLNETAGGAFNAAITFSIDVLGMGDAPSLRVTAHAQITVNANGVVTMEKGDFVPVETCN
jgi:hypothetical protein